MRFLSLYLSVLHASGSFCCVGRWLYDCGASIGRLRKLGSLLRLWATIAGLFPKYAETNLFLDLLGHEMLRADVMLEAAYFKHLFLPTLFYRNPTS